MKIFKTILCAVSAAFVAGSASAAVYNVSGSETQFVSGDVSVTFPGGMPIFSGTFDDVSGAFEFHFSDYTMHLTRNFNTYADITTVGQVLKGTGNGAVQKNYTSWQCLGDQADCFALPPPLGITGSIVFSVANGVVAGTLYTNNVGGLTAINEAYSFSSAVPVPASAWLFGSAALSLMGVARRKTKQRQSFV